MTCPRLLIVPQLTQLEWPIKPLLDEWAEVASYDAPGVGHEPPVEPFRPAAVAERGLEEVDRLGWDRCIVVADEFAAIAAVRLMTARPEMVQAFAPRTRVPLEPPGRRPPPDRSGRPGRTRPALSCELPDVCALAGASESGLVR
jgi:hypothetical protein